MAHNRTVSIVDARSIIAFSDFLESVPNMSRLPKTSVLTNHLGLYRVTVKRLVEAGELPWESLELFDTAFSASEFQPVKTG